ncbi:H-2 class II histocompatibility antigen, A-U alpha chain-like [Hyperolius riggenbachi]|uniref:H-2 class II histocompatibility antigen, A-U alpha chain-like n=1 Tax=Hyperolius riggenbachi TaxID=752182 RepID=UPI0035A317B4
MTVCRVFALLLLAAVKAVEVDYFEYGAAIAQTRAPTGEYLYDYSGKEILHVDMDKKTVVWEKPDFEDAGSFDLRLGLQEIKNAKENLKALMQRSKNTPATIVPPIVRVYTEHPVVLGEPNILICAVRNIFPPVMNMTWLKNGEKIDVQGTETIFLPSQDHSFRKFHYLALIPSREDIYTCEVEHWGLDEPTRMFWGPDVPPVPSENSENTICATGLSVGIIGIVSGVVLILKGMRHTGQRR